MWEELLSLPREQLFDLLEPLATELPQPTSEIELMRSQQAFSILARDGFTAEEVRKIVDLAVTGSSIHPLTIFAGLADPVYASTATPEQLAAIDELLEILPPLLEEEKPWPSYAVEAMFRMVHHDLTTQDEAEREGVWPEVPYRNAEAIEKLLEALQHQYYFTREEAARGLAAVGANDPDLALQIVRALEQQIEVEKDSLDYDNEQRRQAVIHGMILSREDIIQDIREFMRRGGEVADPAMWKSMKRIPQPYYDALGGEEPTPSDPPQVLATQTEVSNSPQSNNGTTTGANDRLPNDPSGAAAIRRSQDDSPPPSQLQAAPDSPWTGAIKINIGILLSLATVVLLGVVYLTARRRMP
ncbi:MAG: hypothetical protein HYZ00_11480 [Candidatus Hydrogenedentes bacterium]|nr:hypothetical protein [Candidatus Hydrogenedentota bacterium]